MLATFTSITSVLWEKMNEGGVFCGNSVDYALCFFLVILNFYFSLCFSWLFILVAI